MSFFVDETWKEGSLAPLYEDIIIDLRVIQTQFIERGETGYFGNFTNALKSLNNVKEVIVTETPDNNIAIINNQDEVKGHILVIYIEDIQPDIAKFIANTRKIAIPIDYIVMTVRIAETGNDKFDLHIIETIKSTGSKNSKYYTVFDEFPSVHALSDTLKMMDINTTYQESSSSYGDDFLPFDGDGGEFRMEIDKSAYSYEGNVDEQADEVIWNPSTNFEPDIEDIEEHEQLPQNNEQMAEVEDIDNDVTMTRTIQKKLFGRQKVLGHKTIGVWSPVHQTGVTTFIINFALFLGENHVETGVLEGIKEQYVLQYYLNRYSKKPKEWCSYASAIYGDEDPTKAHWEYKNVTFLPLDKVDIHRVWKPKKLETYIQAPDVLDITLVDLPTGKMDEVTIDSLAYLDELWIVVDDSHLDILAFRQYIHDIQELTRVKMYLAFNKEYPFSQVSRIEKDLGYPVIAKFPSLHEEVKRNQYEMKPIYLKAHVKVKLYEGFTQLAIHLWGQDIAIKPLGTDNSGIVRYKKILSKEYWKNKLILWLNDSK